MFNGENAYSAGFSTGLCGSGGSTGSGGACSCDGVTGRENNGGGGKAGMMPASSPAGTVAGPAGGTDDSRASTMKCHSEKCALPSKPANRASKLPTFNGAACDRLCTPMMPWLPGWYSKPHSARPVMGSTYSLRKWRRSCGKRGRAARPPGSEAAAAGRPAWRPHSCRGHLKTARRCRATPARSPGAATRNPSSVRPPPRGPG